MSENYKPLPVLQLPTTTEGATSEGCGCHHDESHDNADHAALAEVRDRLATARGAHYWRSLDELSDTPEFRRFLETEFPSKHELWMEPVSRRDFLKLMGAGMSMMFFAGCRKPLEKIFPYNANPENQIPGKPLYYASALCLGGYSKGVIVETHEGRPTKIEGNPQHPDSLGATDVFMQAAVLGLYDPDRSQTVMSSGMISSWDGFSGVLSGELETQQAAQGETMRILSGTITSPTLIDQMNQFQKRFPKAKWIQYEPLAADSAAAGATMAFGQTVGIRYQLEQADVIVSLDADFLGTGPDKLRNARHFARGRKLVNGSQSMNRLYVVEPCPSITGATADHRLPMRAADIEGFARALASAVGVKASPAGSLDATAQSWIRALADDLGSHHGRSVVIVGDSQPPVVHALAHAINERLGNAGQTVTYSEPVAHPGLTGMSALKDLVNDMTEKRVEILFMLGGNPVYDAPADLNFAKALDRVRLRVHLSQYVDETSMISQWHIPETHPLESWADARATDGTVTIAQPMIEPLYGGKTIYELVAAILGDTRSGHDVIKDYWKSQRPGVLFDAFWKTSLNDGIVKDSAFPSKKFSVKSLAGEAATAAPSGLEIVFKADPSSWDGRFANNGWLQETPKPITKLTWDNAALMSPGTASQLGLKSEDAVTLTVAGQSLKAPVWIVPGHADNSVTVHLGYGRTMSGHVGDGKGFNAYPLRTTANPGFATGLNVTQAPGKWALACTQIHHSMEGRDIVRNTTLADYIKHPDFAERETDNPSADQTLYNSPPQDPAVGWGMSIDMNACTGCNACVVGCQAENNISIVGKDQVLRGREMHWIRIDNYFSGDPAKPQFNHQPVTCMHCENAPCEPVCPVNATMHSDEGINEMVYNRCIGTRYCSNNCPYKVRRFNFYQYADLETESLKLGRNPNVTVRFRGVMEKCTYCIQRINVGKYAAENDGNRPVRDGEIVTACQAACPSEAIVFGNMRDPNSQVSKLKKETRNYPLLGELGTRPHTTYLAKVRNTNPELENV